MTGTASLWFTIVGIGLYHGFNPAMGWPLAVANGLSQRRPAAVFTTVLPLGAGHFAAMAVVLAPFAWLAGYVAWSQSIRIAAGAAVLLFGLYKLARRRHPRALARIPPTQLGWWSFLMATAHGAGLMLVPFTLALCAPPPHAGPMTSAHADVMTVLAQSGIAVAITVATVHTLAMMAAGLAMAWAVYRYLGLQFLRRAWINLDLAWGLSLVVAGAAGMMTAI